MAAFRGQRADLLFESRAAPEWTASLLALALAGLALIEIWVEPIFQTGIPGPRVSVSVVALLATLPLAWLRLRPLPALALVVVGIVAVGIVADADQAAFELILAALAAAYGVAAYGTRQAAVIGAGLILCGGLLTSWLTFTDDDTLIDVLVPLLLVAAAWLMGTQVRRHRVRAASLAETAATLAEERDHSARLAAAEERARIARELHDAVAHSVSLTVMQVGAARLSLTGEERQSRELLLAAEERGREALAEMRRMLGLLRADDEPLRPVPSLRQLDVLTRQLHAAGLEVELRVEGEPIRLAPGLDLTAYRIVQEALTNALKHGRDGHATVSVAYRPHELRLDVRNPAAAANGHAPVPGHGLVGIEERVRLFAGASEIGLYEEEWIMSVALPVDALEP